MQHWIRIAKCGHIVSQCRCIGPKTKIIDKDLCPRCKKALESRADSEDAIPSSEAREETWGP